MNPTLDKMQPYTMVGNRLPLAYMQEGRGYDREGQYLGEYDAQGEPTGAAAKAAAQSPGEESPPEAAPEAFKGTRANLKKKCEELGLDFAPNATREELVEILSKA